MNEVLYDDSYQLDDAAIPEAGEKALPAPGQYRVKATAVGLAQKFDKTGPDEFVDANGVTWPVLQVNRIDILEPVEYAQKGVTPFQKIKTRPFQVNGKGQTKVWTAQHITALRSLDRSAVTGLTMQEAITEVNNRLKAGDPFVVNIGYVGTDSAWAKQQVEQLGGDPESQEYKDAKSDIWNRAKLFTKDFKNPDGTYRTETPGKTGDQIKARLSLTFVATDKVDEAKLGPYTS
jgi:hypothetical protein